MEMVNQGSRTLSRLVFTVIILVLGFGLVFAQTNEGLVSRELGQSIGQSTDDLSADRVPPPKRQWNRKRTTHAERVAAAARAKAARAAAAQAANKAGGTRMAAADSRRMAPPQPGGLPDYFGAYSNWANSPILTKFIDTLPQLGNTPNNLGQFIPIANPDIVTYPGSDYYEISLIEYSQRMHSDLPIEGTRLRGYRADQQRHGHGGLRSEPARWRTTR